MSDGAITITGRQWSLASAGISIDALDTELEFEDRRCSTAEGNLVPAVVDGRAEFRFDGGVLQIRLESGADGTVHVSSSIENRSGADIFLRSVVPMRYEGEWGAQGLFTVHRETVVHTYPAERCYGFDGAHRIDTNEPLESCWFLSAHDPVSQWNVLFGIAVIPTGFVRFECVPVQSHTSGYRVLRWTCAIDCLSGARGVRVPSGRSLDLGTIALRQWTGGHEAGMREYAHALGDRCGARMDGNGSQVSPAGWCSWYAEYGPDINESEAHLNLEAAAEMDGLTFFQIDDGWMRGRGIRVFGEPEVDAEKFPRGMKALAEDIAARGLTPGLWIRPFQGWGTGKELPAWGRGPCIDLTHPAAREWLEGVVRRIVLDWGYRYIKFDFTAHDTYGAWGTRLRRSAPARFEPHDDTLTNVQACRLGLEAIRRGAGEDVFLLGCNSLVGPSIGVVDGFRIGDDVDARNWDRIVTMGARSIPVMRWTNAVLWWNDPDCIVVQEPLPIGQARSWATLVAFSGGVASVSSRLHALDPERLAIVKRTIGGAPPAVWTVTEDFGGLVQCWRSKSGGTEDSPVIVGFFNGGDRARTVRAILDEDTGSDWDWHVYSFWEDRYVGRTGNELHAEVPPGECVVLFCTRDTERPAFIGARAHVLHPLGGLEEVRWREETSTLTAHTAARRAFEAVLYIPERYYHPEFQPGVARLRVAQGDEVLKLQFHQRSESEP